MAIKFMHSRHVFLFAYLEDEAGEVDALVELPPLELVLVEP